MVKEVAHSYTQLPDLGFKAFGKSRAYSAAKEEITKFAGAKSPEVAGYLYVGYRGTVIVRDLLGQPNEHLRAQALGMLSTLQVIPS